MRAFVERSEAGYSAAELKEVLGVETKHVLVGLIRSADLEREKVHGSYVYFSTEESQRRRQRKKRQKRGKMQLATVVVTNPDLASDEAKAAILLFLSTLDEHQRRLYAGLESLKLGYGGDEHIAQLFGMDPHTVARGRQELLEGDCDRSKLRASGGGRPSVKKKPPKSSKRSSRS